MGLALVDVVDVYLLLIILFFNFGVTSEVALVVVDLDLGGGLAAVLCRRPLEGGAVGRDEVLPEVPLVLDDLLALVAGDALALDVDVDGVLLQVERVGEGLPAVGADPRLHAPPTVARVRGGSGAAPLALRFRDRQRQVDREEIGKEKMENKSVN